MHVAIIMDGNGRWARARGRARSVGHRAGCRAVRAVVEAAPELGVRTLTLYAFSADNWRRPPSEVRSLMRLFRGYLRTEGRACAEKDVRLSVIGRRDRLDPVVLTAIEEAEALTASCRGLDLRVAIDYSSRDAILAAASRLDGAGNGAREKFGRLLAEAMHAPAPTPEVDLLIRTGGEQRLSDFLLWECAYAELLFSPKLWPDFGPSDLRTAITEFRSRERRFGSVPALAAV